LATHFEDLRDPEFLKKTAPFFDGLSKYYFRVKFKGWNNIPKDGHYLFVGNHNGLLTFEMIMIFWKWYKEFGPERKALGLAHSIAVKSPLFRWLCTKIGGIEASPEIAKEALGEGYSLLVYPGGLKEAFRPFKERKKVDFYQRKGFIRVARDAGVKIIPVVSVGAAESYVILDRGEALAKKLGVYDKMRLAGIPLTVRAVFFYAMVAGGFFTFIPWLVAPFALVAAFIPLPTQMTFRILEPMDPAGITSEEELQAFYDRVLHKMQAAMNEEYKKRKLPVIG
jgi:1-acyl-sn-glycerol-3-phosphate acyltransferase